MQHNHEVEVEVKMSDEFKEYVDGINKRLGHAPSAVKQHLQGNKTTYLIGAGCFAAGYLLRKQPQVTTIVNNVSPHVTPLIIGGGDIPID